MFQHQFANHPVHIRTAKINEDSRTFAVLNIVTVSKVGFLLVGHFKLRKDNTHMGLVNFGRKPATIRPQDSPKHRDISWYESRDAGRARRNACEEEPGHNSVSPRTAQKGASGDAQIN